MAAHMYLVKDVEAALSCCMVHHTRDLQKVRLDLRAAYSPVLACGALCALSETLSERMGRANLVAQHLVPYTYQSED